jgi:hypothetical protein
MSSLDHLTLAQIGREVRGVLEPEYALKKMFFMREEVARSWCMVLAWLPVITRLPLLVHLVAEIWVWWCSDWASVKVRQDLVLDVSKSGSAKT